MDINFFIKSQIYKLDKAFMRKEELHSKYNYIFEKLMMSNKSEAYKFILGNRLLNRLIRESNRVITQTFGCSCKQQGIISENIESLTRH